jgi:homoserine kinase
MITPIRGEPCPALRVRVPASTSNLGPGFDQLGLALELFLDAEAHGPLDLAEHRLGTLEGMASDWVLEDNLLPRAFDACLEKAGAPPAHFEFDVQSSIPLRRGLGSSGAAITAGLILANEWLGERGLSLVELATLGFQLEGHTDNSTASLFGGCTLGIPLEDSQLRVLQPEVHPDLLFAVAWGPAEVATAQARAVLPSALPLDEVVRHLQRLPLLLEGLASADAEALRAGSWDRLHSPFRLPLIPGAGSALAAAESEGAFLATISGSGSAVIAAHDQREVATRLAATMARELAAAQGDSVSHVLRPYRRGAHRIP